MKGNEERMEKYCWLNTKKGGELVVFAEELHKKLRSIMFGESSSMLGGAMAASLRQKALELDISPDEAVEYYFSMILNRINTTTDVR